VEPVANKAIQKIILHHHDRYDGMSEKQRESIPLGVYIVAVADAFDAMTSERPYRSAMSKQAACMEIKINSGKQFDPRVVSAFLDICHQTLCH
jgi:response regulator RpfG family c-di-GMP phosphodiesterase